MAGVIEFGVWAGCRVIQSSKQLHKDLWSDLQQAQATRLLELPPALSKTLYECTQIGRAAVSVQYPHNAGKIRVRPLQLQALLVVDNPAWGCQTSLTGLPERVPPLTGPQLDEYGPRLNYAPLALRHSVAATWTAYSLSIDRPLAHLCASQHVLSQELGHWLG